MRQTISGLIAAVAVVAAGVAPASACGLFGSTCEPSYVAAPVYNGCGVCGGGGWAHERLPDPVQQYYYADQGPDYSGPGDFAPYPTYRESAVSGWGAYRHRPYHYGYDGGRYADATNHYYDGAPYVEGPAIYGYRAHPHFRPWRVHSGYGYHQGMRYGYASHHGYASHYSLPPREFYGRHHTMRYGYTGGAQRHYGYREHMMQRHY